MNVRRLVSSFKLSFSVYVLQSVSLHEKLIFSKAIIERVQYKVILQNPNSINAMFTRSLTGVSFFDS